MCLLETPSSGRSLLYSQKRVAPKMECYGKPAFMGHFCVDFSSMSNQHILWTLTWISIRLKFVKKSSVPNPVKNLAFVKCYSCISLIHVKSPNHLSETSVKRSAVKREDLPAYRNSEKRPSQCDQQAYYLRAFHRFFSKLKNTNRAVVLSHRSLPIFLKHSYHQRDFPTD